MDSNLDVNNQVSNASVHLNPTDSKIKDVAEKNITQNNAVKEYFPAVFFNKIDSVGKVAIAAFFVLTAPASLLGHALAIGIMSSIAKKESQALMKEWGLDPKTIDSLNLELNSSSLSLIKGELKNPTVRQLIKSNIELKTAINKEVTTFNSLAVQLKSNDDEDEEKNYHTDKSSIDLPLSHDTLSIINSSKKPTLSELKAANTEIKNAIENETKELTSTLPTASQIKLTTGKIIASAVKIVQGFKSDNSENQERAKNHIAKLSDNNIATLYAIIGNESVSEKDIIDLNKAIHEPVSGIAHPGGESISKILIEIDQRLSNVSTMSMIDATYETDGKGIEDFAYSNQAMGLAFVVDGSAHGHPLMAKHLNIILNAWTAQCEINSQGKELNKEWLAENLSELESMIMTYDQQVNVPPTKVQNDINSLEFTSGKKFKEDASMLPIGTFIQIEKGDGDVRKLNCRQYGDGMFMVMKPKTSPDEKADFYSNEEYKETSKSTNRTLGLSSRKNLEAISTLDVIVGDVVYIFSDGIGEFLTTEETQDIFHANKYPHLLLDEFKQKIIEKGVNHRLELEEIEAMIDPTLKKKAMDAFYEDTPSANGARGMKYHNPNSAGSIDDLSMSIIKVT